MAYTLFAVDKPDITDTGAEVIDNTRENLMALRDAVVAGALMGWDMAASGGTAAEPTQILYTHNVSGELLRLTVTWGTSSGEDGNPKVVVYAYDGGGGYDTIGTWTASYDSNGNLTAEVWS
jgi:hypothetical protein